MNNVKAIRDRLGLTQDALGEGMGCTQGNVGHYERGQTVPPDAAKRLINYAATLGHAITFDDIYGEPAKRESAPVESFSSDKAVDQAMTQAAQAGLVERRHRVRRAEDRAMRKALKDGKGV